MNIHYHYQHHQYSDQDYHSCHLFTAATPAPQQDVLLCSWHRVVQFFQQHVDAAMAMNKAPDVIHHRHLTCWRWTGVGFPVDTDINNHHNVDHLHHSHHYHHYTTITKFTHWLVWRLRNDHSAYTLLTSLKTTMLVPGLRHTMLSSNIKILQAKKEKEELQVKRSLFAILHDLFCSNLPNIINHCRTLGYLMPSNNKMTAQVLAFS